MTTVSTLSRVVAGAADVAESRVARVKEVK